LPPLFTKSWKSHWKKGKVNIKNKTKMSKETKKNKNCASTKFQGVV